MPLETTIGQLLINQSLPEDMRSYDRVLNKGGVADLFTALAEKHPEKYRQVAKDLSDIGRDTATETGGYSFGLRHLRTPVSVKLTVEGIKKKIREIRGDKKLPDDAKNTAIIQTLLNSAKPLQQAALEDAKATGNPLAGQITSGARGNPVNLNSLIGADLLYVDHRERPIPLPVLRNYAQGLRPAEYYASAFGARKGLYDLKIGTADAGYLGKQLTQAAHRLLVSADDDPDYDETSVRGLPAATDDPEVAGSLLARPVGKYPRNTVLTPRLLKELRADGHDEILVRSPMVGGPADGGVYSRDVGVREKGRLAPLGDFVGISAAQAISEPLAQSVISSKHSGGVAGASAGAIGGFKLIDAMSQAPKVFPGGAAHAQLDGRVDNVREAPQGGWYISVNGQEHYAGPHATPVVKPGDTIEAGDLLTKGNANPAELVRHKGIGEGRREFANRLTRILKDAGINAHRRNVELVARGLINHVRLTDEVGDWVPDDVIPYQALERQWSPRAGTQLSTPQAMVNRYLEQPALHYSIGTRITPSVVKSLQKYGVNAIHAHTQPPPFEPEMIRGMANVAEDPDWSTRLLGSYQSSSLLDAAHRGRSSNTAGTSYVPALMEGANFGIKGLTKGFQP